jgi:hypothetical protein
LWVFLLLLLSFLLFFSSFLSFPFLSFPFLSFFLNKTTMPRSKKGRISGGARKEINGRRAAEAVSGKTEGIIFARITKVVGSGHAKASIDSKRGPKELLVRIPNLLGRRGATPINASSVVSIYVGVDFDPNEPINPSDHFDITAILTQKQAYSLQKDGEIPSWMAQDIDKMEATAEKESGFEFDYSEKAAGEEDDSSDEESDVPGFSRKAAREDVDKGVDIDNI